MGAVSKLVKSIEADGRDVFDDHVLTFRGSELLCEED